MTTFKSGARYARSGRRVGRPSNVPWSAQEIENCMALYDDDLAIEDIAVALGRGIEATRERVYIELRKRHAGEKGCAWLSGKITPEQEAERLKRRDGYDARDITSTFFGDPPRGFSALDKQRQS